MASITGDTRGAVIGGWVCTFLIVVMLLARIASDKITSKGTGIASYMAGFAVVVMLARSACGTVYLETGTVDDVIRNSLPIPKGAAEIMRLQTGSILVLVCRALDTTFYWLQCGLLLLLYHRVLGHIRRTLLAIRLCWAIMAITYVVAILYTFLECHPFHLYYQLHPPPGRCILAYGQLLAQGISNILIDLVLLLISFPIVRLNAISTGTAMRLSIIYLFGTIAIIVSGVRIALTYNYHSSQVERSLWASIQSLTAALVANASSVYGGIVVLRRRFRPNLSVVPDLINDSLVLTDTSRTQKSTPATAHVESLG